MTHTPEFLKLQQSVRESRLTISREYAGLLDDLDVRKRFTESVRHHPLGWIGGAAAAGLVATLFGGRRGGRKPGASSPRASATAPTTAVSTSVAGSSSRMGWLSGALEVGKMLFPILRPVVVELLSNAAQAGLAKRGR